MSDNAIRVPAFRDADILAGYGITIDAAITLPFQLQIAAELLEMCSQYSDTNILIRPVAEGYIVATPKKILYRGSDWAEVTRLVEEFTDELLPTVTEEQRENIIEFRQELRSGALQSHIEARRASALVTELALFTALAPFNSHLGAPKPSRAG